MFVSVKNVVGDISSSFDVVSLGLTGRFVALGCEIDATLKAQERNHDLSKNSAKTMHCMNDERISFLHVCVTLTRFCPEKFCLFQKKKFFLLELPVQNSLVHSQPDHNCCNNYIL